MEQFIAGQDPSKAWTDAEQEELVRIFQAALTNVNWSEIEHAAVVSRIETWRRPLSDDRILKAFLDQYLWPSAATEVVDGPTIGMILAIRLAANCCLGSEHIQSELAQHFDQIQPLLAFNKTQQVVIGLLANMIYDDCSVIELSTLLEKGFQETIASPLAYGQVRANDAMYGTALEILDSLVEEDIESKILNRSSSIAAVNDIILSLLPPPCDPQEIDHHNEMVRILLLWSSSNEIRSGLVQNADTCLDLALVFGRYVERHVTESDWAEGPQTDIKLHMRQFESLLGELVSQITWSDTHPSPKKLIKLAVEWIPLNAQDAIQERLCATAYLILCNMCNNDFATAAVSEFKLHEITISTLRNSHWCQFPSVRTNAGAFLANLCQPAANKDVILKSRIVNELFYDGEFGSPALSARMLRRLVSNTDAEWVKDVSDSQRHAEFPTFIDILEKLPDQKELQDSLKSDGINEDMIGAQTGPATGQQLARDVGHIYVDVRRRTSLINEYVTTNLIWCLANLVLIGLRHRNVLDISDGVFGLGLALQGEAGVAEPLALDAIEALRGTGFVAFKQVIEMGKGNDAGQVAKKVAENATNVLNLLVGVAERNHVPQEVVDSMKAVLRLGIEVKMGSEH